MEEAQSVSAALVYGERRLGLGLGLGLGLAKSVSAALGYGELTLTLTLTLTLASVYGELATALFSLLISC